MTNNFEKIRELERDVENAVGKAVKGGVNEVVRDVEGASKKIRKFWHDLGPGLTTGASDDDPSGIATFSQVGARYGLSLLWLSLFTFPLMSVVQVMCARIGIVTGQGLAANIRRYYPRPLLYVCTVLLLAANIFNIGANLGAMAKSFQLLVPSFNFGLLVVLFGVTSLLLQVFTTYEKYARYLKYLALILVSYVVTVFFIDIEWGIVFKSLVIPSFDFSRDQIFIICAIFGTTISPYLFFWQTSQEVEEKILHHNSAKISETDVIDDGSTTTVISATSNIDVVQIDHSRKMNENDEAYIDTPEEILAETKKMNVDVWSGVFVSHTVMFFIMVTCAFTLHANGITNIEDAADAALALKPFAGQFAFLLFALGIVGTGMLAIPILAGSAAYAVSESFGWKFGLYRKLKEAYAFYGVIAAATLVGVGLNFIGLDPIKALIYSAVGNGLVAPVILYLILDMSSRESVMGVHKNGNLSKIIGWVTVVLMSISAIAVIVSLFS